MTAQMMAPEIHIARLEDTVNAMITLLHKETAAVKAVDLNAFAKLQKIKADLFDVYQTELRILMSQKAELKSLPTAVKDRIRGFEKKLTTARMDNLSTLDRAVKSFSRLRDRIMHVARETALRSSAQYGANGSLRMRANQIISTGHQDRV